MDWRDWHRKYDVSPSLQARLRIVSRQISDTLDECPSGPVKIISLCAGDGRDLIMALTHHRRRDDVVASLLDTHDESLIRGRRMAMEAGLERRLQFLHADAALARSYLGIGRGDLVILSGLLGHLRHEDVPRLIASLPMLCKAGGWVIWNRHLVLHDGSEQVPSIREILRQAGFDEVHFEWTAPDGFAAGRARFSGQEIPLDPGHLLFDFVGLDRLLAKRTPSVGAPRNECSRVGEFDDAELSIPACLERVASVHACRPAIAAGAWQPTYGELNTTANRVAHFLLSGGGAGGDRVALLLRHDAPLIASVLGVLKAGRVVVVLNPTDPPARLEQVLDDAEPTAIVTDALNLPLAGQIARGTRAVVRFEEIPTGPGNNPGIAIDPGGLAFLIYTSGSTGRPKGVMQTHRNLVHNARRHTRGMSLTSEDRIIHLASLSGGLGVATTWCALLNGAALCPFPVMERGVTGLADWMVEHRISVYVSSTSVFRNFMRTLDGQRRFPYVRLVRLGSESATSNDVASYQKHFSDDSVLYHTLSSSEAGNVTQCHLSRNDRIAEGRLPVGQPADGMEILLLDSQGREVALYGTGEMCVRSRHLSPGYWRNESLTAERFSSDSGPDGVRTFRTGDLARRNAEGLLVFMGRKDAQVKIHGYRIEVSEIEDALARQSAVEKAVVCERALANDDIELVAYVVLRAGRTCTVESLRTALRAALPGYMVPAGFVFLSSLPLTPHGKIDKDRLREIHSPVAEHSSAQEPATETEVLLAGIWSGVLGRASIGRHESFFDLGGDSLSAMVVAAQVHAALTVQLDLRAFADHPTLAPLAAAIDKLRQTGQVDGRPGLVRVSRQTPMPLSFAQERTWKYSRTPEASAGYTVACSHRIRGPLNIEMLRECMSYIERRHEILRTTFDTIDGKPVQIVHPSEPVSVPLIDLTGVPDAEAQAGLLLREEGRRPFDLARRPLVRFTLVRIRPDEHRLLRANHHINSDGWSWSVYFRELAMLYEAKLRGEPPPLPEFELLQYGDYAAWQRSTLHPDGPAYRGAVEWWRKLFSDMPRPVNLPFLRRKPLEYADPVDGLIFRGLDPTISRRLDEVGREEGATFFGVRLAALVALLADESRQPDVILGIYVTNRNRVASQNMFGFFANLATLRLNCDFSRSFCQWVALVQRMVVEIQARAEIPYEQLSEELRQGGVNPPEIRAIFGVSDHATVHFGGLELTWLERRMESMPWGFSVAFDQNEDHRFRAVFDARIYDPDHVRAFLDRFAGFLDAASSHADRALAELLTISRTARA